MPSAGSLLVALVVFVAVGYLAYRIHKERRERREKISFFRDPEDRLVSSVERWVLSRQLTPLATG